MSVRIHGLALILVVVAHVLLLLNQCQYLKAMLCYLTTGSTWFSKLTDTLSDDKLINQSAPLKTDNTRI